MKKFCCLFILFFMLIPSYYSKASVGTPSISSEAAVLIDATTGKILYNKNAKEQLAPASTTKIMTALLTLEKTKLSDEVTIGKNPPNAEGTAIGLKEGEVITVNDLLHGLLLESANDCAEALAEHISGSIKEFSALMNQRAKELGCTDTNFVNPSGLYEKDHLTTAYDLSLILREVAKHSDYLRISQEPFYKIQPTNKSEEIRWVNNKNSLVLKNSKFFYDSCIAGKTGFTTPSKHTFTAISEKNGQRLIATILRSDDKTTYFPEAKALFDYGFSKYELVKVYARGDEVGIYKINDELSIPVLAYEDLYYVKDKELIKDDLNPIYSIIPKDLENLSFNRGDKILESNIYIKNELVGKISLASGTTRTITPLSVAKEKVKKNPLWIILLSPLFVFLLMIIIRVYNLRRKRLKRIKRFNNIAK